MDFFISSAAAQTMGQGPGAGSLIGFLPYILIFVVFYFMLIRPQNKKMKEHQTMVSSLQKGDEVNTNGGLLGRITKLDDNYVVLEISDNVEVSVQRQSIASMVPKGTMKTLK